MTEIDKYLETEPLLTPAVVGYLQIDGKVLLGLRKKVSFGLGENLVAGIGGKVGDTPENEGETNDDALVREIKEEIGVTIKHYKDMGRVRFLYPAKPKWNQDVRIYIIDEWEGEPVETDAMRPTWYDQNELPESQMWEDNRIWLPKVLKGEAVDAIFMFDNDNQKVAEYVLK